MKRAKNCKVCYNKRKHWKTGTPAFQTRGGLAVSGQFRAFFPFPAMATWNKAEAIKSAKKILPLNISLLAIGHGNLLENAHLSIESLLERERG